MTLATITISAYIDGRDHFEFDGASVEWSHINKAAVGRFQGHNYPTNITINIPSLGYSNSVAWTPTWPSPPPAEIRYPANSSSLGIASPLSSLAGNLTIEAVAEVSARWSVTVVNAVLGDASNPIVVDFNDDPLAGPAWYTVELIADTSPAVPGALTMQDSDFASYSQLSKFQFVGAGAQSVTLGANAEGAFTNDDITLHAPNAATFTVDGSALDGASKLNLWADSGVAQFTGGAGYNNYLFTPTTFDAAGRTVAGGSGFNVVGVYLNGAILHDAFAVADSGFVGLSHINVFQITGAGAESVTLGAHAEAAFTGGNMTLHALNAASFTADGSALDSASHLALWADSGVTHFTGGAGNNTFLYTPTTFDTAGRTATGGSGFNVVTVNAPGAFAVHDSDFIGLSHINVFQINGPGAQSITLGPDADAAFTGDNLTLHALNASSFIANGSALDSASHLNLWADSGVTHFAGGAGSNIYLYTAATFDAAGRTVTGGSGNNAMIVNTAGNFAVQDSDFIGLNHIDSLQIKGAGTQSVTLGADAAAAFRGPVTVQAQQATNLTVDGSALTTGLTATGGSGVDLFIGGAGNNTFRSGGGVDKFTFSQAGHDVISGFNPLQDVIDLVGWGVNSFAALAADIHTSGVNTIISVNSTHTLQLNGVAAGSLTSSDFLFS